MAVAHHDPYPYPEFRGGTPRRQLLTVSELERLFGPDATVELRSTRPEHVEADLEVVVPPRRTSRWMAPVLVVVFAAASLLGYALLRTTEPMNVATSLGNWLGRSTLGPTEETPIERTHQLPPFVARTSDSSSPTLAPGGVTPEGQASGTPPSPPLPGAAPPSVGPPEVTPAAPIAEPKPEAKSSTKASAPTPPVRPARAARREADDRATGRLIERELERLRADPALTPDRPESEAEQGATYPPGYIQAEID